MIGKYRQRIADKLLERKLAGKGGVLIEGAKWCGKTTTAEQIAKSVLYMSEPGYTDQNLKLAKINPKLLLRGEKPRLIDEWQIAPTLWEAVEKRDISVADHVQRDAGRTHRLLRSYARHQGAQASYGTIKADLVDNEGEGMDEDTIASYIKALKRIFVIEDVEAWNPNLRSKTAIRTSDTRYFTDPSIATAALGIGPKDLINDLNTFRLIFETLCMRDLRVYGEALNGNVYHFRDKSGLECDAVVHLRDGRYGLIEIKLGGDDLIKEGVATLTELAAKIDTTKMKKPSFLMVLTGVGDYAYKRPEDGVLVVPIGCLKP